MNYFDIINKKTLGDLSNYKWLDVYDITQINYNRPLKTIRGRTIHSTGISHIIKDSNAIKKLCCWENMYIKGKHAFLFMPITELCRSIKHITKLLKN